MPRTHCVFKGFEATGKPFHSASKATLLSHGLLKAVQSPKDLIAVHIITLGLEATVPVYLSPVITHVNIIAPEHVIVAFGVEPVVYLVLFVASVVASVVATFVAPAVAPVVTTVVAPVVVVDVAGVIDAGPFIISRA
ncbi:hypothetical protein EV361DRAFT_956301 [Lentinula raphanica]|nr:hypothetical protein EV361DRAFT_956301 [Lentinula raphanica]